MFRLGAPEPYSLASPGASSGPRRDAISSARVEAAKARPAGGDELLGAVARAVGFGSEETLRCAFDRETAATPVGYRSRFRTTGG